MFSLIVDIYVNGVFYEDDFEYFIVIGFVIVFVGVVLEIVVVLEIFELVDDVIFIIIVMFDNGVNYMVIVNGIVGDVDFLFIIVLIDGV